MNGQSETKERAAYLSAKCPLMSAAASSVPSRRSDLHVQKTKYEIRKSSLEVQRIKDSKVPAKSGMR